MPTVSVILAAYNAERYIAESIESVLNQTFSDFELLVVDDGSIDGTQDKIAPYIDKIRYIKKEENEGPAAARNTGILASRGDLIAFQDADDIWLPEKLEKQVRFLEDNKDIAMVYTDFMEFDENGTRKISFFAHHKPVSGWIFGHLLDENPIGSDTVLVRKDVFEKCGLFDALLRTIEDYDMWLKIAHNYKISFIDEVFMKRRRHNSNLSGNGELMAMNGVKVFEKINDWENLSGKLKLKIERQLGLHYWDLGWCQFSNGRKDVARQEFLLSYKYQKSLRTLCYCLLTLFSREFLGALRQTKRQFVNHILSVMR